MNQSHDDKDSNSNRGTLIAVGLCIAFYFGWSQYISNKYPDYNKTRTQPSPTETAQAPASSAAPTTTPSDTVLGTAQQSANTAAGSTTPTNVAAAMNASDLVFDTNDYRIVFNQNLASPTSIQLKRYHEDLGGEDGKDVELLHRPLVVQTHASFEASNKVAPQNYSGRREGQTLIFERLEGPWLLTQTWSMPESGYVAALSTTWTNKDQAAAPLKAKALFEMGAKTNLSTTSFFNPGMPGEAPRFLWQVDGSDSFTNIADFCSDPTTNVAINNKLVDFFGFDHHYFAVAFIPSGPLDYKTMQSGSPNGLCEITSQATSDLGIIAPGESASIKWTMWFGPKEVDLLSNFNPKLKTTLGLGWFDMIAQPLLLAIKGLYKMTGNYGVAIIILTILLKILFYPLAKQAAVSAAKMKKLNPEMTKLREKYKQDPQRMQMELMKFMSQNKINPMKGCLPILPTIPVFFALFRVLSASIELRHAPFYGWILDLSAKDPYLVTPIILTVCMFIQQKMTPMTGMDPTQEKVMMFMPLIFGVMMISLPSGLVLYMLTNTIISIMQQQYLNKKLEATA
jgi:YidC/Oxa1 family membrane protein insertase